MIYDHKYEGDSQECSLLVCRERPRRVLLVPKDSSLEAPDAMRETELHLRGKLANAFSKRDREVFITGHTGVSYTEGAGIDFRVVNYSGTKRVGVHALATIQGANAKFFEHLLERDTDLEMLWVLTTSQPDQTDRESKLKGASHLKIEVFFDVAGDDLPKQIAERLWDELAEDLPVLKPVVTVKGQNPKKRPKATG